MLCVAVFLTPAAIAEEHPVLAGAAERQLDLPLDIPLAGYSRRGGKIAQGVLDLPGVRAVVFKNSDREVALVSIDILIVDEYLYEAVHNRLASRFPSMQLFLTATHTHAGPGAYGKRFAEKISMGHYESRVFDAIVEGIVQTVDAARQNLQRDIRISLKQVSAGDWIHNRMYAEGREGVQLSVITLRTGSSTEPLAVILHFAAHPTVLGADNFLFSADYPGAAMRALKSLWPEAVLAFIPGAVGDQAPEKRGQGRAAVEAMGGALAAKAEPLIRNDSSQKLSRFLMLRDEWEFDEFRVRVGDWSLPGWISRRLIDDEAALSLLALEDILLIGVPCDMTQALAEKLRVSARERGYRPLVVGFSNDYVGYCVTAEEYDSDHYEAAMAFNGPSAGEDIAARLVEMMEALNP